MEKTKKIFFKNVYCIHIKKLSKTEGIQEKRGGGGAGGVFISFNNNKNYSAQLKYINITYKIFVIIVNNAQTCYSMLFIYLHWHSFVPPSTYGGIPFHSLLFLVISLYFLPCIFWNYLIVPVFSIFSLVFPGISWYSQVFPGIPRYSLILPCIPL